MTSPSAAVAINPVDLSLNKIMLNGQNTYVISGSVFGIGGSVSINNQGIYDWNLGFDWRIKVALGIGFE